MRNGWDIQSVVRRLRRIHAILDGVLGAIDRFAEGAYNHMEVPGTDIGAQPVEPFTEHDNDIYHDRETVIEEIVEDKPDEGHSRRRRNRKRNNNNH